MTKDYFTFESYIRNHNTENTNNFLNYFGEDTLTKLPNKVCSSKYIYDILSNDLTNYFKQRLFRETFMEYFRWKLTQADL